MSINLVLDLRAQITNQDIVWLDSDHIAGEMETPSCTAELKLTVMRLED